MGICLLYEEAHCPQAHQNAQSVSLQMYKECAPNPFQMVAFFPCRCERAAWIWQSCYLLRLQKLPEATVSPNEDLSKLSRYLFSFIPGSWSLQSEGCFIGHVSVEPAGVGWFRAGAANGSPQCPPPICINTLSLGTQTLSFIYMLSMAAFTIQWPSWTVTGPYGLPRLR